MNLLAYILVYPILYLISLLPFRLLYMLSDLVYLLLYYVIGYRKKTVTENLRLVFPDKDKKEIDEIRRKSYRHLCDMFLEMIKSISISEEQLVKRFKVINMQELKRLEEQGKSILVMFGHYASYEWSVVVAYHLSFKGFAIYKRLKNPYFDRLVKRIRSKYDTQLIHTKEAVEKITRSEERGERSMTGFLSDQSPKSPKSRHWTSFMGIPVPCYTGAEVLAKKLDLAVSYLKIDKVKRGYYEAEFIPIADNARDFKDYEITDIFTRMLEKQIYYQPEYYLWTHKRWKHRNKTTSNSAKIRV